MERINKGVGVCGFPIIFWDKTAYSEYSGIAMAFDCGFFVEIAFLG